jgi:hypothetical protein
MNKTINLKKPSGGKIMKLVKRQNGGTAGASEGHYGY